MDVPGTTYLLLQMGDSEVLGFSSDSSGSDGSSWEADTIDQGFDSDESDSEMIFQDPMDNDVEASLGIVCFAVKGVKVRTS